MHCAPPRMGSSSCCVSHNQVPQTPEYSLEDRAFPPKDQVRGSKAQRSRVLLPTFFTTFFTRRHRPQPKTHPTPPPLIKSHPVVTLLKKSPPCPDLRGLTEARRAPSPPSPPSPVKPPITRVDLINMRRQFFSDSQVTTTSFKSNIPVPTLAKIGPPVMAPLPPMRNVNQGQGLSRIPIRTSHAPAHPLVKKPTPSKPFYTNFLYKPSPPVIKESKPSQLDSKEAMYTKLNSSNSSHEKIDPPEKYPHSSTEEIYLIDDEISDQPLLTFCGGEEDGFQQDHHLTHHHTGQYSSLSSIASLVSEGESVDGLRNDDSPPPSEDSYFCTCKSSHNLHTELTTMRTSLELLKKLLLEQQKRERAKDLIIQNLIKNNVKWKH